MPAANEAERCSEPGGGRTVSRARENARRSRRCLRLPRLFASLRITLRTWPQRYEHSQAAVDGAEAAVQRSKGVK